MANKTANDAIEITKFALDMFKDKENNNHKLQNKTINNTQKLEESKYRIAHWFIIGYVILLLFIFIVPLVLYLENDNINLTNLKEIVTLYNGVLASLTGMLGFVVGYYFTNK